MKNEAKRNVTRKVSVKAHTSARGKGLSYPAFKGTLLEECNYEGWDVVDVKSDKGEIVSVYSFDVKPIVAIERDANEVKHTPTPWNLTESMRDGVPTGEVLWLENTEEKAHLVIRAYAGKINQARIDAAFIVKAVNAHEELVSMISKLREAFYVKGTSKDVREAFTSINERFNAIAKAEALK